MCVCVHQDNMGYLAATALCCQGARARDCTLHHSWAVTSLRRFHLLAFALTASRYWPFCSKQLADQPRATSAVGPEMLSRPSAHPVNFLSACTTEDAKWRNEAKERAAW